MKTILKFFVLTTLLCLNGVSSVNAMQDKMVSLIILLDTNDDKQVVATIFTSLAAAEKVSQMMDIELVASDENVDDVFVFALKSEEQKQVTMKMFDEEGYELSAHRIMQIEEGNNYKALNVESLTDGTYIFQLSDENGNEITRSVKITH